MIQPVGQYTEPSTSIFGKRGDKGLGNGNGDTMSERTNSEDVAVDVPAILGFTLSFCSGNRAITFIFC